MLTEEEVFRWCASSLNSDVAEVGFVAGNLSRVAGVTLDDGRVVVLKVRPWQDRLLGCTAVQRQLTAAGYPCPELLAGPDQRDDWAISAETAVPGGDQLEPVLGAAPFATLLHRLIQTAPRVGEVPSLSPSPPWAAWEHEDGASWAARDDTGRDLNRLPGPPWVDHAAGAVRHALACYNAPRRIGHGDWESQNIRWNGQAVLVVHDWDSVIAQPEAAIVGLAAAVWPAQGAQEQAASIDQSAEFIAAYERAHGGEWTAEDRAVAWTAGLWVRLFNAKKDAADGGGPQLDQLEAEIDERLEHAGLNGP